MCCGSDGTRFDLLAQAPDVNRDGGAVSVPGEVPYLIQKLGAREHPTGLRRERLEEVELLAREAHGFTADLYDPAPEVEACVPEHHDTRWVSGSVDLGRVGPAQDGPHARDDLLGRERLRHVVVGAQLQPDDAIGLLTLGRHEDHRGPLHGPGAHPAQNLETVHAREHEVQEHERGGCGLQRRHRLPAVGRGLNEEPVTLEIASEDLPHHGLVVHHEHALAVHLMMMAHGCCESLSWNRNWTALRHRERPSADPHRGAWLGRDDPERGRACRQCCR